MNVRSSNPGDVTDDNLDPNIENLSGDRESGEESFVTPQDDTSNHGGE